MKIGPLDTQAAPSAPVAERKGSAAAAPRTEPSARVELSSHAAAAGGDVSTAEFDAAKVERIARAIRSGEFQIDAEAIADKLIANAQELLPKASH